MATPAIRRSARLRALSALLFTVAGIVLVYALIFWPAYAVGLWGGARLFQGTSERAFRISAYVLIGVSAVLSAPVMDRFFK